MTDITLFTSFIKEFISTTKTNLITARNMKFAAIDTDEKN
jgi:hypothetical protein